MLRVEKSRDCVPFALFDGLSLYLCNGPVIERILSGQVRSANRLFNSRSQSIYRIAHRLTELVQALSFHPSVERFTDIGAVQPDLDVLQFVGHRVLVICELVAHRCTTGRDIPLSS